MYKRVLFLLFVFCVSSLIFAQNNPHNPYTTQQPSSWQGTGWAINGGYVVTNHHVVDGARTLRLKCVVGETVYQYNGEVAIVDEEHDLAIIKINDSKFNGFAHLPYALKVQLADVGESVFVLGYPMTSVLGDEIKLTTGVLSSRSGYQGDATSYQVSAPIQPGNSGGPLFDDNGNVIGVVNAKVTSAENVGYAIKAQYLKDLVSKLPNSSGLLPASNELSGKSLPQKVKAVQDFIFMIYASTQSSEVRSNTPKYGAPSVSRGDKTISRPYVDYTSARNLILKSVTLKNDETILEFAYQNTSSSSTHISIARGVHLRVNGQQYRLRRVENVALAPNKTLLNGHETKNFRIYFQPIPKATTSFDFIEASEIDGMTGWTLYGVSLKD